jgi:phage gp45-like
LVVATDDRRHRPTGLEPGEVAVYNSAGARVTMQADGNIAVTPAAGGRVEIQDAGGAALSALDELVHGTGVDPFSGATYGALGNTSARVRAGK